MTNISILKIESNQKTILISKNAKQEILPMSKLEIMRNINSIPLKSEKDGKLKTIIETKDNLDISSLNRSSIFKIYSIIKFKQFNTNPPLIEFVKDSLERFEDYIIFRPILKTVLTNFNCKTDNSGPQIWKLEFEEI